MRRADSFEKTLMLGKIEGRRRRGQQRMRWLDGITHLEPDILECEVKWALEKSLQTKLVEMMEFQLSSFKS